MFHRQRVCFVDKAAFPAGVIGNVRGENDPLFCADDAVLIWELCHNYAPDVGRGKSDDEPIEQSSIPGADEWYNSI